MKKNVSALPATKADTIEVVCRCGARGLSIRPRDWRHVTENQLLSALGMLATDRAARCGTPNEAPGCRALRRAQGQTIGRAHLLVS